MSLPEEPNKPASPAPRRVAPPPAIGARAIVSASGSGQWRLQAGYLLVESGVVLPEVCIYSGAKGEPLQRIALTLSCPRPDRGIPEEIRLSVFQSAKLARKLMILRRTLQFMVPALAGYLVWLLFEASSRVVIAVAGTTFAAFTVWEQGRGLTVELSSESGWYRVRGVHPAAIAQLRALRPYGQDLF